MRLESPQFHRRVAWETLAAHGDVDGELGGALAGEAGAEVVEALFIT